MSVKKCKVHNEIKDRCVELIRAVGAFEFDSVIDDLGYGGVADSIKWHIIREMIEEEHGISLVPVYASYFHPHSKAYNPKEWKLEATPGAFLAQGYGKKAAGYISLDYRNATLVLKHLKNREALTDGAVKSTAVLREKTEPVRLHVEQLALPKSA